MQATAPKLLRPDLTRSLAAALESRGFCVGIELFLPSIPMPGVWALDELARRTRYFLSEWPGFGLLEHDFRTLPRGRAVSVIHFAAPELTRLQVEQAKMWWKGIPLFADRSVLAYRETYDYLAEALTDLGLVSSADVAR